MSSQRRGCWNRIREKKDLATPSGELHLCLRTDVASFGLVVSNIGKIHARITTIPESKSGGGSAGGLDRYFNEAG